MIDNATASTGVTDAVFTGGMSIQMCVCAVLVLIVTGLLLWAQQKVQCKLKMSKQNISANLSVS